jgi:hypothetical protein
MLWNAASQANELNVDALVGRLARPAPATTEFVEVRFSSLLDEPVTAGGQLEYLETGALVRRVETPYRERSELLGKTVTIEREGARPRRFSIDRAPELRGLMASFGALLAGDKATLDEYFQVEAAGQAETWRLTLIPRDRRLGRTLSAIVVNGREDAPRCFRLEEKDGDASIIAIGSMDVEDLPKPLERRVLETWCSGP